MVDESKRILLGYIGCAVAANDEPKGHAGTRTLSSKERFAGRPVASQYRDDGTKPQRTIDKASMLGQQGAAMLLSPVSSGATSTVSSPSPES
ncbi:hypothetical protein [Bradyrhizobium sp. AZCC 2289]|uniref:hypothetical protein n=1 Tax=Bradyrhizobium sp. AZCC 2289 TaxID=3117026 RepID=UPI002FF23C3C